jgi:hypothetical protein
MTTSHSEQRVFDKNGVRLDYGDPGALRQHHAARRTQASDRLRLALLRAERELNRLEILIEHLEVSDIGIERIYWSLRTIRGYLELERPNLGLQAAGGGS